MLLSTLPIGPGSDRATEALRAVAIAVVMLAAVWSIGEILNNPEHTVLDWIALVLASIVLALGPKLA